MSARVSSRWTVHARGPTAQRAERAEFRRARYDRTFSAGRSVTAIERSERPVAEARLRTVARGLLDASSLCAIATVTPAGRAHVNTAYFAWDANWRVVWLSEPRARHSRNLRKNATAAVAVFDSRQTWGKPDRGIQLFGSALEATGPAAETARETYGRRFPQYGRQDLGA